MGTNDDRNIVLTGFMGTGKSVVGKGLAARLKRTFIDTDDVIVQQAGQSIPEIFAQEGEAAFRYIERRVCRFYAGQRRLVIATGGGMLVDLSNLRVMLASGFVVCLNAKPDTLRKRLAGQIGRPLLSGDWEALLEQRRPSYAAIPNQVYTDGKTPDTVLQEVIELWQSSLSQ